MTILDRFTDDPSTRTALILGAVRAGRYDHRWIPLDVPLGDGYRLRLHVSAQPLRIDGIPMPMSARTEQQVADLLDAHLLTPKISDLIHSAADVRIAPLVRPITNSPAKYLEQASRIDRVMREAGVTDSSLVSGFAKDWTLWDGISAARAANYGLYTPSSSDEWQGIRTAPTVTLKYRAIQSPPGTRHDLDHDDYSQLGRFVARETLIISPSGSVQPVDFETILRAPDVAPAISSKGPMEFVRQPGVAKLRRMRSVSFMDGGTGGGAGSGGGAGGGAPGEPAPAPKAPTGTNGDFSDPTKLPEPKKDYPTTPAEVDGKGRKAGTTAGGIAILAAVGIGGALLVASRGPS